jgi:flagellar biosynthesis/type III secretory pathway chaperone
MTDEHKRIRDLIRLLEQLRALHDDLFSLIDSKIVAMRRADVPRLTQFATQEGELTARLRERETFRGQLMETIGKAMGMTPRAARALTISQLVEHVEEGQRPTLLDAAQRLRGSVMKVMQANRIAGTISRELLDHLKWVLSAVRPREDRPGVYCGDGGFARHGEAALVELVG